MGNGWSRKSTFEVVPVDGIYKFHGLMWSLGCVKHTEGGQDIPIYMLQKTTNWVHVPDRGPAGFTDRLCVYHEGLGLWNAEMVSKLSRGYIWCVYVSLGVR
eukprot:8816434-Pyramimonas_sp.AAC.1